LTSKLPSIKTKQEASSPQPCYKATLNQHCFLTNILICCDSSLQFQVSRRTKRPTIAHLNINRLLGQRRTSFNHQSAVSNSPDESWILPNLPPMNHGTFDEACHLPQHAI
jgi:hypothetical protein